MAVKSKSGKKKTKSEKSKKSEKKAKKEKKQRGPTRKDFILNLIKDAGKKGIATKDLVEATDKQFSYGEDKSSRMRVNNTIKGAVEEGLVETNDGKHTWVG